MDTSPPTGAASPAPAGATGEPSAAGEPSATERRCTADSPAPAEAPAPPRPQRPARPMFGSTVLWCELLVVFFALLVAYGLRAAEPSTLAVVAGVGMVACGVAARLQRSRAGIVIGSAVQVLLILGGLLVPMMFLVGILFAIIWTLGVWLGLKIDRERAERAAHASTLES